jgi:hypothetical protein
MENSKINTPQYWLLILETFSVDIFFNVFSNLAILKKFTFFPSFLNYVLSFRPHFFCLLELGINYPKP